MVTYLLVGGDSEIGTAPSRSWRSQISLDTSSQRSARRLKLPVPLPTKVSAGDVELLRPRRRRPGLSGNG